MVTARVAVESDRGFLDRGVCWLDKPLSREESWPRRHIRERQLKQRFVLHRKQISVSSFNCLHARFLFPLRPSRCISPIFPAFFHRKIIFRASLSLRRQICARKSTLPRLNHIRMEKFPAGNFSPTELGLRVSIMALCRRRKIAVSTLQLHPKFLAAVPSMFGKQ